MTRLSIDDNIDRALEGFTWTHVSDWSPHSVTICNNSGRQPSARRGNICDRACWCGTERMCVPWRVQRATKTTLACTPPSTLVPGLLTRALRLRMLYLHTRGNIRLCAGLGLKKGWHADSTCPRVSPGVYNAPPKRILPAHHPLH